MKAAQSSIPEQVSAELDAQYRAALTAYFVRRTGSHDEAEDLTRQVFLRLSQRVDADDAAKAGRFIFMVANELLRGRTGVPTNGEAGSAGDAASKVLGDYEPALLARETLASVLRALEGVDPRARAMFLLYRDRGMKQSEIAQKFGVPLSTVEQSIVKVLKHVAVALR